MEVFIVTISIKQIKSKKLNMRLKQPFTTSFGRMHDESFFITQAIDAKGTRGFGECVAFISRWYSEETVETNLHVMEDFLTPILKENAISHPDDVSRLFDPIKRH